MEQRERRKKFLKEIAVLVPKKITKKVRESSKRIIKTVKKFKEKRVFKPANLGLHCHCDVNKEALLKLLEKAKYENVKYLAITNHVNLDIILKVLPTLSKKDIEKYKGIKIIPATEVRVKYYFKENINGEDVEWPMEIHLLGYGVDLNKNDLLQKFAEKSYQEVNQKDELDFLIQKGRELGLIFEENEMRSKLEKGEKWAGIIFGTTLRADEENLENNFCTQEDKKKGKLPYDLRKNPQAFYSRCMIDRKSPFFYEAAAEGLPDLVKGIELIKEMGGKVYLAHPVAYFSTREEGDRISSARKLTEDIMEEYGEQIDGIEVFHPSTEGNIEVVNILREIAKSYKIATSGGTDIHIPRDTKEYEKKKKIALMEEKPTVSSNSMGDDKTYGNNVTSKIIRKFNEIKKRAQSIKDVYKNLRIGDKSNGR